MLCTPHVPNTPPYSISLCTNKNRPTVLHILSNKLLQLPQTTPLPRQLPTRRRRLYMLKQTRQQPILPMAPRTEKRTRILGRREVLARLVTDFCQRIDLNEICAAGAVACFQVDEHG